MSECAFLGGIVDRTAEAMSQTGQIGSEPVPSGGFLDSEEIVEAFKALSAEDRLKLLEIERVYLRRTDLSPGDLLHEALCSAIMGDRNCPRDEVFMAFLVQSMRSIASHHLERHLREAADGGASAEVDGAQVIFSAPILSPEQILLDDQESHSVVTAIQGCFEGDYQAQMLILGWTEGYRGKELRDLIGVDQAALDYLIKRVRRTMTNRYPNGWKKP
jgi:DNA-directed RNA polymerase specialized sigma24 family protein